MVEQVEFAGLKIAKPLYDFALAEALPGTGIDPDAFWAAAASIIHDLAPKNAALLAEREALQTRIDDWHRQRRGALLDLGAYKAFLEEIGYLVADEIGRAHVCTPVTNAHLVCRLLLEKKKEQID